MGCHRDVGSAEKLNGVNRLRGRSLLGGVALCVALASGAALAQDTSPAGTGGVTGDQIKQILGLNGKDEKSLGTGMHFKLGIVLALTGPGSYYGRIQGNGAKLGVAQIKAAGGPDIELIFKDHKTARCAGRRPGHSRTRHRRCARHPQLLCRGHRRHVPGGGPIQDAHSRWRRWNQRLRTAKAIFLGHARHRTGRRFHRRTEILEGDRREDQAHLARILRTRDQPTRSSSTISRRPSPRPDKSSRAPN